MSPNDKSCDFIFCKCAGLLLQIFSEHNLSFVRHKLTTNANTCYIYSLFHRDLEGAKIQNPLYKEGGLPALVQKVSARE